MFGGCERQGTTSKEQRPTRRQVHNLASWLEAWNIFLAVHCPVPPLGGSPTGKVPSHNVPSLLSIPSSSLSQVRHFVHAARDKSKLTASRRTSWRVAQPGSPFALPNTSQVRPAQDSPTGWSHQPVDAPIPTLGRRSAENSTLTSVPRNPIAPSCTPVRLLAVGETMQPSPAPR